MSENHDRLQAYIDVLQQHGILVEDARILHRDYEVESGVWAFEQFQELEQKTEAYVCANENIAVGLCHRAQELGYKIPEDFLLRDLTILVKHLITNQRLQPLRIHKKALHTQR